MIPSSNRPFKVLFTEKGTFNFVDYLEDKDKF